MLLRYRPLLWREETAAPQKGRLFNINIVIRCSMWLVYCLLYERGLGLILHTRRRNAVFSHHVHSRSPLCSLLSLLLLLDWFWERFLPGIGEQVPGTELVVTRTAYKNNHSKYEVDGKVKTFKEVRKIGQEGERQRDNSRAGMWAFHCSRTGR